MKVSMVAGGSRWRVASPFSSSEEPKKHVLALFPFFPQLKASRRKLSSPVAMFSRALAPSARLCAQQTALPLRAARVSPFALSRGPTPARLAPAPFALAQKRTYANHQPAETSEHAGRPVTSTSHPTVPKTPPEVSCSQLQHSCGRSHCAR